MTAGELRQAAREAAERTALAQGLPARISDQPTLRRVVAILGKTPSNDFAPAGNGREVKDPPIQATDDGLAPA